MRQRTSAPARRWPVHSEDALARVQDAIADQQFLRADNNPAVDALERHAAAAFDCRYAVSTNSGTSALLLAYLALALPRGAKVLCPAYTFYATVTSLLPAGLEPVLVDMDPVTLNVDLDDARRRAGGAAALVVTHNWGNAIPTHRIAEFAMQTGIPVVEDGSHLTGQLLQGAPAAHRGQTIAVSLGMRKVVSGGAGGVLLMNDETAYRRAMQLSQPSRWPPKDEPAPPQPTLGFNFRMSPLSALLALDIIRNGDRVRRAWKDAAQAACGLIEATDEWDIPPAPATTLWYKLPVVARALPARFDVLSRRLTEHLDVTVDGGSALLLELPELAAQAAALPGYRDTAARVGTVDLSREVARRYLHDVERPGERHPAGQALPDGARNDSDHAGGRAKPTSVPVRCAPSTRTRTV